jgi:hypothetical protein
VVSYGKKRGSFSSFHLLSRFINLYEGKVKLMSSSAIIGDQMFTLQHKGNLTTGVKEQIRMPFAGKITFVTAALTTAPAGSTAIFDLNKNGTTMYTTQGNRPTIAAAANSVTATNPDVLTWAAGDRLAIEVDQKGSGTAGANLTVCIGYVGNTATA